jgi:hypothetical protein
MYAFSSFVGVEGVRNPARRDAEDDPAGAWSGDTKQLLDPRERCGRVRLAAEELPDHRAQSGIEA